MSAFKQKTFNVNDDYADYNPIYSHKLVMKLYIVYVVTYDML